MGRDNILLLALGNPGPADEERHANIFVEGAGLAWWQPVLANVESIVGCVDDVRVVDFGAGFQTSDERVNQFVNALQGTQTLPVIVVVVVDDGLVAIGEIVDPTGASRL